MPYSNGDGTYHDRRRCRRLHNTGGRIRSVESTDELTPCEHCVGPRGESENDTCEVVKSDGEVCGRERPCPYHD